MEISGAFVLITRDGDEALADSKNGDLGERKKIANESDADIIISIHQNSFTSPNVKGAQVFYHNNSEEGKRLAFEIQSQMAEFLGPENDRSAKANTDYYILKNTSIPAVIVECGFLSSPSDEEKLNTQQYQEKVAWAIYMGINNYFNLEGQPLESESGAN